MWNIIIVASLAVLLTAEDTKNVHSPCSILLNEVSLTQPAFVEVGKFCGNKENSHELLAGYYVVVIEKENLVLRFFKSLHNTKIRRTPTEQKSSSDTLSGHKNGLRDQAQTSGSLTSSRIAGVEKTDKPATESTRISGEQYAIRQAEKSAVQIEGTLPSADAATVAPDAIITKSVRENSRMSTEKVPPSPKVSRGRQEIDPFNTGITQAPAQTLSNGQSRNTQPLTASQLLQASKAVKAGDPAPKGLPQQISVSSVDALGTSSAGKVTPYSGGTRVGILRRPANPATESSSNKQNLPAKKSRRSRRAVVDTFQTVYGLTAVPIDVPEKPSTLAIILLYLPFKRRTSTWDRYKVGLPLSAAAQQELQEFSHDLLLFTSDNDGNDHSELMNILPRGADMQFFDILDGVTDWSLSKCSDGTDPFESEGFIYARPTMGHPNLCNDYREPQPFSFKGKSLKAQSQELIVNTVWNLRKKLKDDAFLKMNPTEASAMLLNLSRNTIYSIMSKYQRGETFTDAKKPCRKRPVTELDEYQQKILYSIITSYYRKNTVPRFANVLRDFVEQVRLEQLKQIETPEGALLDHSNDGTTVSTSTSLAVQDDSDTDPLLDEHPSADIYHCGAWSFTKILDRYGYKYGKLRTRDAQIFKPNNLEWRKKYLDAIKRYDEDPEWQVVYQDETWIDPHRRADRGWVMKHFDNFQQRLDFTFQDAKISRGTRIIILAVGGENGFVNGATEIYPVPVSSRKKKGTQAGQSCVDSDDYHSNVDGDKFLTWLEKVFVLLGDKKTVVVMDNCPFHRVIAVPKESDLREDIRKWLAEKKKEEFDIPEDVSETTKLTKAQFMVIVNRLTDDSKGEPQVPKTKVQQLAKKYKHRILRLPPYNPDLNPIEYVWSDIKREVREKNTEQTVPFAMQLAQREFRAYTADQWKVHVKHVKKVEAEYRAGDQVFANVPDDSGIPELITAQELQNIEQEIGGGISNTCADDEHE